MPDRGDRSVKTYPPAHLSPSSVSLLSDCSRLWEGKYKRGKTEARGDGLILGSAFDATAEWFLRRRHAGAWPTGEAAGLRFAAAWEAELARPEPIDWGTRGERSAFEDGLNLATSPATLAAWRGITCAPHPDNPAEPALQVQVQLAVPGVSVPVIGFIDCLALEPMPGGSLLRIIDFKTARRAWPRGKERKELQARIYAAALWQGGEPFSRLRTAYWVFLPGMTPEGCRVQKLDPLLTERDVLMTMESLRKSWRQIEAGVFTQNPHSWRCNDRCPLWEDCGFA